jgi:hypothetical protein
MQQDLHKVIEAELKNAESARLAGNEGRARVCARRAAGIAARSFLTRHGAGIRKDSAYESLKMLAAYPGLAPDLQSAAGHLITRVTEEFTLPQNVDLIAEARKLIGGLG